MELLFFVELLLAYSNNYTNFRAIISYASIEKINSICSQSLFYSLLSFCDMDAFFDQRNFFLQRDRADELEKLEQAKSYYEKEISTTQEQLNNLQSNPGAVEKYARERYLLRREGEEVYLFEDTAAANSQKNK